MSVRVLSPLLRGSSVRFFSGHLQAVRNVTRSSPGGLWASLALKTSHSSQIGLKQMRVLALGLRWFSEDRGSRDGKKGEEQENLEEIEEEGELEESEALELFPSSRQNALAPVAVPKSFPNVPLLPISRSPIFPRLARILEVKNGYFSSSLTDSSYITLFNELVNNIFT